MAPAQRDRELVADLSAQCRTLCEAQMMGVTRCSPTDEASLLRHIFEVVAIAQPARLGEGQGALSMPLLSMPWCVPCDCGVGCHDAAGCAPGYESGRGVTGFGGFPDGAAGWSGSGIATIASVTAKAPSIRSASAVVSLFFSGRLRLAQSAKSSGEPNFSSSARRRSQRAVEFGRSEEGRVGRGSIGLDVALRCRSSATGLVSLPCRASCRSARPRQRPGSRSDWSGPGDQAHQGRPRPRSPQA